MNTNEEEQIKWICDQIRAACANTGGLCAEEILTLTCSLESSVEEYYANCDSEMSLGDVVESYLADNPEKLSLGDDFWEGSKSPYED